MKPLIKDMKYLKRQIIVIIAFFIIGNVLAQQGIVDCSQVIKSEILNRDMPYSVFLPQGYEESNRPYPVLYLLHGWGGDHTNWVTKGEVNRIASSLITKGDVPDMIVIMPDGIVNSNYINYYDKSILWEDFFYEEFIPGVERKYRIMSNRRYRAIAGLSMGGNGALYHSIKHKDMFKTCYALSAAVRVIEPQERGKEQKAFDLKRYGPIDEEGFPSNYKKYSVIEIIKAMDAHQIADSQVSFPLISLDCGDDDAFLTANTNLVQIMKEKNLPVELRVRDGGHNWEYWRTGLELALKFVGNSFRN